jgi:hypothetical protein
MLKLAHKFISGSLRRKTIILRDGVESDACAIKGNHVRAEGEREETGIASEKIPMLGKHTIGAHPTWSCVKRPASY